ncbi:hypothetical protein B296_00002005 [Ensete ventricosum]|uniref:RST domain-containing protein n=1 Tax=Ensete ventricosum TaxID=4639 RepID=A0A427BA78_ENSVE|nr:hypothetical protein B296_00002005 [Ensete ventricosum]
MTTSVWCFGWLTTGLSKEPGSGPTSPWTCIKDLISMLSRILPRSSMCQIRKLHNELMERKTTRLQLVRRIRRIYSRGQYIALCHQINSSQVLIIRRCANLLALFFILQKAACSILASRKDGKSS